MYRVFSKRLFRKTNFPLPFRPHPTYVFHQLQNNPVQSIAENQVYTNTSPIGQPSQLENIREDHTANSQAYTLQYINNIPCVAADPIQSQDNNNNTSSTNHNNNHHKMQHNNQNNHTNNHITIIPNISRINSVNERGPITGILRNKVDKTRSFVQKNRVEIGQNRLSNGSNINRTKTISYMPSRQGGKVKDFLGFFCWCNFFIENLFRHNTLTIFNDLFLKAWIRSVYFSLLLISDQNKLSL